jgi:NAD(P)-dependent dehydrogenase (short-subunit alcohol dehydrogenase family)
MKFTNDLESGVFPSRMTSFGVDRFMDTLLQGQPTGRVGQPSDIAGLILFLSSKASAHITGNAIAIDGGSLVSGWKRKSGSGSKI